MSVDPLEVPLPPAMPQFTPGPGRRCARWLLHACGWKLAGALPDLPRLVLIAAPHSSWWDGVWGLLFKFALGADVSFMAKRELFKGPLGWLLRRMGGIPIDRGSAAGVVEQMAERFRVSDRLWLGITPEGTRKSVKEWKTGFWHVARRAGVPILPVYFHYPEKTIGLGPLFHTSKDMHTDVERLREWYRPWQGKYHGVA